MLIHAVIDMFSYVFMKIIEMRPRSYDKQMDKVSQGRIRTIKESVASEVPAKSHVLEIGCGTGELASMMIQRTCTVEGFDLSPSMVKTAQERIESEHLKGKLNVNIMGIDGMDVFPDSHFDAIVSTLVFSELNDDERRFAIKHSERVLKPGGYIVIADEVVPRSVTRRIMHSIVRLPLLALTYLVSGHTTRPLADLAGEIIQMGFIINKEVRGHGDSFAMVVGRKQNEGGGA